MKTSPTLADLVLRYSMRGRGRGDLMTPQLRDAIIRARRFVLDDSMSAFLADLSWQSFLDRGRQSQNMDNARRLARLPHDSVWIEWDEIAMATRASSVYGSDLDPKKVPYKSGYLMVRHPTVDGSVMVMTFGEGGNLHGDMDEDPYRSDDHGLGISRVGMAWTSSDVEPIPWPTIPVAAEMAALRGMSVGGMATGLMHYQSDKVTFVTPHGYFHPRVFTNATNVALRNQMLECFGMMRYLLCLLATINDLPVKFAEVRPSKGFIAKGNYRKFLDHTTVTLSVPTTRYASLARKTLMALKRRAHEVRGHWRDDWRHPGSLLCNHDDYRATEDHMECTACGKRRIWIANHVRGDASLGFVNHGYTVTHPTN